jgi:hypothetical protein
MSSTNLFKSIKKSVAKDRKYGMGHQPKEEKLSPMDSLVKFQQGQVGSVRNRIDVIRCAAKILGETYYDCLGYYDEQWIDKDDGKKKTSANKRRLAKAMKEVRQQMVEDRVASSGMQATMAARA